MAEMEPNRYKAALEHAAEVIDQKRTALAGDGGMGSSIRTKIAAHEGWVCDAADDWVTDFAAKCTPVINEFDTAYDEVKAAADQQPAEVRAGHPHGLAYGRPRQHGNIPV